MTRSIWLRVIAVMAFASACGIITVAAQGHERRPARRVEHPVETRPSEPRRTEPRRVEPRRTEPSRPEERRRSDPRRAEEAKRTEGTATRERKKVPAADSARARQARVSSERRLFRARETMKKQLPGPHYLESRFDKKGPNDKKNLREQVYTSFNYQQFKNRQLERNETFYRYSGENKAGRKVSWLVKKKYASEAEFRRDVAVTKDFSPKITRVTEYNVPKGTRVSEGLAENQGKGYEGGGYQAVITNVPRAWKVREDRPFR